MCVRVRLCVVCVVLCKDGSAGKCDGVAHEKSPSPARHRRRLHGDA
jgi:hypothetical protein